MLACRLCLIHITDLTSAQRSNIPSGQTSCRPMHSHIIILFTHKSIHNSDRKGIKYRMSYPRWSTSLVVNKQFWSDQSAVDQNETSKRNQLPHDPTTNPGIRSNGLWSHHLNPDTDIRKCDLCVKRMIICFFMKAIICFLISLTFRWTLNHIFTNNYVKI
jgi:hypothetical protein